MLALLSVLVLIVATFYGHQKYPQGYVANIQTFLEMTRKDEKTQQKVLAREVIEALIQKLSLKPNKDYEKGCGTHISAYGLYKVNNKDLLVRISDHNTFMQKCCDYQR